MHRNFRPYTCKRVNCQKAFFSPISRGNHELLCGKVNKKEHKKRWHCKYEDCGRSYVNDKLLKYRLKVFILNSKSVIDKDMCLIKNDALLKMLKEVNFVSLQYT